MKALSLWQPWASLIAIGVKTAETRHWAPPADLIGQRVAIHAAKRTTELYVTRYSRFRVVLEAAEDDGRLVRVDRELPLGAVVATATLREVERMTPQVIARVSRQRPDEIAFGHWEPGRFAWWLSDVEPFASPIPFRGAQGLFDFNVRTWA